MKPFIKPRPFSPPQPEVEAPKPGVSLNDLTVFATAAAIPDPEERAAYLDKACVTNAAMRSRVEERLAERMATLPVAASQSTLTPPARIEAAILAREQNSKDSPALALVPVSAMQFPALPPQLQRQVTFAWGSATLMALAVGALAVIFYFEKDARVRAEASAKEANAAAEESLRDREKSNALALEAKTEAQRTADALAKAEQQRDAAVSAAQETARLRIEAEKAAENARIAIEAGTKAEKEQLQLTQRTATTTLADSLAALATFQLAAKSFAEAEASARQCLELRTGHGVEGWPLIEAQALLGEASLQRNADAEAERLLTAAGTAIEALGAPTNDTDRARFNAASKRISLFFNATGRRKEASDWKRRLDAAVARPPA